MGFRRERSWTRLIVAGLIVGSNCSKAPTPGGERGDAQPVPDERPVMVNGDAPFHYPGALYARKLQGNVTLRIYVDVNGSTVPESTKVEESSGYPAFDSSAVAGARDLRFVPAKLRGEPMGMTILFPVYFRHPEAPAMQGDSILRRKGG
jgi:protein TonB